MWVEGKERSVNADEADEEMRDEENVLISTTNSQKGRRGNSSGCEY
jgi:hypothetical protein